MQILCFMRNIFWFFGQMLLCYFFVTSMWIHPARDIFTSVRWLLLWIIDFNYYYNWVDNGWLSMLAWRGRQQARFVASRFIFWNFPLSMSRQNSKQKTFEVKEICCNCKKCMFLFIFKISKNFEYRIFKSWWLKLV